MTDVDRAILQAWQEIGPKILADPDELAKRQARRALAAKLNRPYTSPGDHIRQTIATLRQSGLSLRQIAEQLNRSYFTIKHHSAQIHRAAEVANSDPEISNAKSAV